jgi:hypothetical protein
VPPKSWRVKEGRSMEMRARVCGGCRGNLRIGSG